MMDELDSLPHELLPHYLTDDVLRELKRVEEAALSDTALSDDLNKYCADHLKMISQGQCWALRSLLDPKKKKETSHASNEVYLLMLDGQLSENNNNMRQFEGTIIESHGTSFISEHFALSIPAERCLATADRIASGILRLGQLGSLRHLESTRARSQNVCKLSEANFKTTKGKQMCLRVERLITMLDQL